MNCHSGEVSVYIILNCHSGEVSVYIILNCHSGEVSVYIILNCHSGEVSVYIILHTIVMYMYVCILIFQFFLNVRLHSYVPVAPFTKDHGRVLLHTSQFEGVW